MFERPYGRIADIIGRGIAQQQTAPKRRLELADLGVLQARPAGRSTLFVHPKLPRRLTMEGNSFEPYGGWRAGRRDGG